MQTARAQDDGWSLHTAEAKTHFRFSREIARKALLRQREVMQHSSALAAVNSLSFEFTSSAQHAGAGETPNDGGSILASAPQLPAQLQVKATS